MELYVIQLHLALPTYKLNHTIFTTPLLLTLPLPPSLLFHHLPLSLCFDFLYSSHCSHPLFQLKFLQILSLQPNSSGPAALNKQSKIEQRGSQDEAMLQVLDKTADGGTVNLYSATTQPVADECVKTSQELDNSFLQLIKDRRISLVAQ